MGTWIDDANPRLKRLAQPLVDQASAAYQRSGEKQRLFTYFTYQADSWDRSRTVIAKAEHQSATGNRKRTGDPRLMLTER